MAVTPSVLIASKQAEAVESTQYISTAPTRTIIDKFTGYNSTAAAVTLTVRVVNSGGTASAANTMVVKSLAAGESYAFPEVVGHVMGPGDFISTLAGTATSVTIRASGRQVT